MSRAVCAPRGLGGRPDGTTTRTGYLCAMERTRTLVEMSLDDICSLKKEIKDAGSVRGGSRVQVARECEKRSLNNICGGAEGAECRGGAWEGESL